MGNGGVSPSSVMNTSCESSSSSGSASRCTRVYNPETGNTDLNGRHSSSADEGFTSGSSPVNGIPVPMLLSPQSSSDTQETTHLMEAAKSLGHVSSKKLPAPTSSHRSSSGTSTNSLRLN